MGEQTQSPVKPSLALVSALVAREGRVALLMHGRERWRVTPGCTFVPLELPGCLLGPGADPATTLSRLTLALLGQPGRLLASMRLYGPSPVHAIDRLDSSAESQPLPLLRLERGAVSEQEGVAVGERAVQRVMVRAYRVALAGEEQPSGGIAGILWATPRAMRAAMRGIPMGSLLAETDVVWRPCRSTELPEDALAYVPGDFGERQLLRVVAKYGAEALFQGEEGGDGGASSDSDINGSSAR